MEEKGIIIDEAGVLAPWDEKREGKIEYLNDISVKRGSKINNLKNVIKKTRWESISFPKDEGECD